MENDDARIIAISLGIPSATLLSIALILAIRFRYRPLRWIEVPNPTVTTNQTDSNNGILLEQRPPWIIAPIPRRPIQINNFLREEGGEILSEETSPVILERRPPTPPRRCTPVIILTPTGSPDTTPYVPWTPSPGMYTQFAACTRGFDMGRDTRPIAPTTSYDPWGDRNTAPPPPAYIAPNEFWDNIDIPYSTYFPSDCRSPDHQTLPLSGYIHAASWDRPIQNQELTPEPVSTVEEPVTSSSTAHLHPSRNSYWQNVEEQHSWSQCRPPWATTWERLSRRLREQPQPPPELLAPPQPQHGCFPSESDSSDTAWEPRPRHPSQPLPSTESPNLLSRPPSWCSMTTPVRNIHNNIHAALKIYDQNWDEQIPQVLTRADYRDLYNYFAYKLPFVLAWGRTQAGNDYFMKRQRGIPADDILQYKAERNAHLLYNKIHPDAPMWVLTLYEDITAEIEVQEPMPDEPPVASPWTMISTFSYVRGNESPGTNTYGYRPFAGADPSGGPPAQLPPAPPIRWVLPQHPAPPKAPTPPVPWVLTDRNVAPYDNFKPKILKEVDDFKGDSSDISRFFLKYKLHFKLFNRHFHYPLPQSHLLHLSTHWWCREMVGTVCQAHRENRQRGTVIPHLWGF